MHLTTKYMVLFISIINIIVNFMLYLQLYFFVLVFHFRKLKPQTCKKKVNIFVLVSNKVIVLVL